MVSEKGTCDGPPTGITWSHSELDLPLTDLHNLNLMSSTDTNRRSFFLASAGVSAAGFAALTTAVAQAAGSEQTQSLIQPGDIVLFQGDSITDARRNRDLADKVNNQMAFGAGYAWMAASQMLVGRPDLELKCYNRGISGNKVYQLAERWQSDCLDLKPNVLSVLIGVNDFWHKLNGSYDGTVEVYENDYHALVSRTMETLPKVRLVICEPFVLNCGAVNSDWLPEFNGYRSAARRVAERVGAVFVPFQELFDRAIAFAPPEHWAGDGVHPTDIGDALMANAWLRAMGV
jgi:lysophospholipase L1-like esterase